MSQIKSSQITPEHFYLSRRRFLIGAGALVASTVLFGACRPGVPEPPDLQPPSPGTDELGDKITPYKDITHYNNFYEFSLQKEDVAQLAQNFQASPWTVTVGGLVRQPQTFDIDDLRRRFPAEERIYRLRCVEAWSMVIPWDGFSLAKLLDVVEPKAEAKYVRFESLYDPKQMSGQQDRDWGEEGPPPWVILFPWPYVEGLRLDEARHNLTMLATGIYGKPLLPQSGAPLRLVVPWKYGYKSIKSIVKIDLVEEMPLPFWVNQSSAEYGFYANVNPAVSHPRWSQASERRIGETKRRATLLFNGYDKGVAPFYQGMDLEKLF